MNTRGHRSFEAALGISDSDRDKIAAELSRGLELEPSDDVDAAWAAEIEKRIRSIDDGSAKLIPWDNVMQEIDGRLNG